MGTKRFFALLSSLLLVVFVMLASISMPTYAQEPIKLRVNMPGAPTNGHVLLIQEWLKKIEAESKGKIEMEFYIGAMLGSPTENYQMVKSGMVDFSGLILGLFPGQFPLAEVIHLPFLGTPNAEIGSLLFWKLYEKFPEIRSEFSGVKVIALDTDAPNNIAANKAIRKMEDLKGVKLRTLSGPPTDILKALGVIPVTIPPPDAYTSLERKVIDGCMWSWEAFLGFKLDELLDYYTVAKTYTPSFAEVMNINTWNKLPSDIKKIFNKYSGLYAAEFLGKGMDHYNHINKDKIAADRSKEIIYLPPKEINRWEETCKPIWSKWVSKMEAKGLPGREVLQEAQKLQEQLTAEHKK